MSRRNYWTTLRQWKISRRTMLGASAKAGVGAAGLALVGCGDDDDDAAPAAVDTSAIDAAAGDASAAAEAASAAAEAAGRAAEAAEAASALAAEAASSDDAAAAAAAAQAAADAAADAADAARAAGDAGAAAVAQAAADAAEAAAAAAREAGAEDTAAAAAAAQAAADAAAAAAAAAGEASAAAAETAAAAVAAAEEAADAAREAADAAGAGDDEPAVAAGVNLDAPLRYPALADAGGLDPNRAGSSLNYVNSSSAFATPMFVDNVSSALTANTVEFEVVDPTNYIVHHREGVKFHDGTPQTAEDVLFTHERLGGLAGYHDGGATTDHPSGTWTSAETRLGAQNWKQYDLPDPMTLRIEVEEPDATFPGTFFRVGTLSKAYVERVGDAEMDVNPMGSGPFRFVSHTDDTDFIYTRYDDYHWPRPDGPSLVPVHLPWVKDLIVPVRPELLSQVAGLEAGELDVVYGLPTDLVEPFRDAPDIQVVFQSPNNPTHHLMPNTHNPVQPDGSPNPWLDLRVRQAANHAINKQVIIDNVLTGTEKPSFGPGPTHNGYAIPQDVKDAMYFNFDPDKAKALLAEAGYADGFDTTLHIVLGYQPIVPLLALVVQQDLEAVGIRTTIKEYPRSSYFTDAAARGRPGEAGLWWFFTCACPEPQAYLGSEIAAGGHYSISEYPETNIEDLYQAQKAEFDPARRTERLIELNVAVYQNASWIYLTEAVEGVLLAKNVEWDTGTAGLRKEETASLIKIFNT